MTRVGVVAYEKKTLRDGLEGLRNALAHHGVADPIWRQTADGEAIPGMVADLLEAGVDLLFAWGGDGTVRQCVEAIGGNPVALAVLPAGTGNVLAANLRIPEDIEEAVQAGLFGRRTRIDVGTLNGERFTVMAGAGFDAAMMLEADAGRKDRFGRLAYLGGGARSVGVDPVHAVVEADGQVWYEGPVTLILAGNMPEVFGGVSVFPDARTDDGLLDVGVVTAGNAMEWARTIGRTLIGDAASSPFVESIKAAAVDVTLETALPYELDGDVRPAATHLSFRSEPDAITVCVPSAG